MTALCLKQIRYKQLAFEPSFYLEDDVQLSSRLKVNTGFRLSAFLVKKQNLQFG